MTNLDILPSVYLSIYLIHTSICLHTFYGGGCYYGTRDNTTYQWGVPFNFRRPTHSGDTGYEAPDEMMIASGNFEQWVCFDRSNLDGNNTGSIRSVHATDLNRGPYDITVWDRVGNAVDPYIFNIDNNPWTQAVAATNMLYVENGIVQFESCSRMHTRREKLM